MTASAPQQPARPNPLRVSMEQAVERLLAALDAMDGDSDLEPSLSASENPCRLFKSRTGLFPRRPGDQRHWIEGGDTDEREAVSEDEGAACEDEGGQCEGGGDWDEREPDDQHLCNWQDEGDQTHLRQLPVYSALPPQV